MNKSLLALIDVCFLLVLCSLFYLAFLGGHVLLMPDEGRYAEVVREMLMGHHWVTPTQNGVAFLDKPILVYWLTLFSMKTFGITVFAIRLVPAFFGVFGVVMTYLAGSSLFNRRTALCAALILMTSPLYLGISHYFNTDLAVSVLVSTTLFLFIMAMRVDDRWQQRAYLWLAYIFAGCAILAKGLIGIAFPIMIIGAWVVILFEWRKLKKMCILSGFVLLLLIALPWYLMAQRDNPQFFHYFFVVQQFQRFTGSQFNMHNPVYYYPLIVFLGLLPWSVFFIQALPSIFSRLAGLRKQEVEWFLVLWIVLITVFFSIPASKVAGYIVPVFPPIALLLAAHWDRHWDNMLSRQSTRWCLRILALFFAAIVGASIYILFHHSDKLVITHRGVVFIIALDVILITALLYAWRSSITRQKFRDCFLFFLIVIVACVFLMGAGVKSILPQQYQQMGRLIKQQLKPGGVVVAYNNYNTDITFYSGRVAYVVAGNWHSPVLQTQDDWRGELAKDSKMADEWKYLINAQQLAALWQQHQVVAYLKTNDLNGFKVIVKTPVKIIAHYPQYVIVTQGLSQPTSTSPQSRLPVLQKS